MADNQTTAAEPTDGRVTRVQGSVIDVEFPVGHLPDIYNALKVKIVNTGAKEEGEAKVTEITLEVEQHLGDSTVRCVALKPTDGLVRGASVSDTVLGYAVAADANNADELLASNAEDGTVKVAVEEAAALFGEHVKVGQFAKISGPHVEIYAHKKSVEMPPSIVAMIATDEAGAKVAHEAALQISAMGAKWLSREDVPADVVESERRVATEKSLAEGKPEKIVPKIVEGRLNAFYKEVVLLEQPFVKDPSKTVGKLFEEVGGKAVAFARIEVGKGEEE